MFKSLKGWTNLKGLKDSENIKENIKYITVSLGFGILIGIALRDYVIVPYVIPMLPISIKDCCIRKIYH